MEFLRRKNFAQRGSSESSAGEKVRGFDPIVPVIPPAALPIHHIHAWWDSSSSSHEDTTNQASAAAKIAPSTKTIHQAHRLAKSKHSLTPSPQKPTSPNTPPSPFSLGPSPTTTPPSNLKPPTRARPPLPNTDPLPTDPGLLEGLLNHHASQLKKLADRTESVNEWIEMDGIVLARLVDDMTLKIEREHSKRPGAVSIRSLLSNPCSRGTYNIVSHGQYPNSSTPRPEAQPPLPTAARTLHALPSCISKRPRLAPLSTWG